MTPLPFVARVSRWRTGLMIAACAGFGVLGWFGMARDADPLVSGFGWTTLVFAAACMVVGTRQLLRSEPVIEIDARGVRWRRWSDVTIPWRAIASAQVRSMSLQRFLCLTLHDRAAYPSTHLLGRLAGANRALGYGDIALSVVGTDRAFAELRAAVATYHPVDVE